ncbi:MAG: DUF4352 domain-containing protein [Peptococcaceae bacterium]|nr:DUF4352 domain-containing protein [Peptococcaceae bacterium]
MAKMVSYKSGLHLVIFIVLILFISACGGQPNTTGQESTQPPAGKDYGLNEEVNAGKIGYVVSEVKKDKKIGQNEFLQKTTENQFLIIKVKVTNNDKETRTIDTSLFKLLDSEGKEYSAMADADLYVNEGNGFFLAQVNPGTSKSGFVVFEIPENVSGLKLQVSSGLGWSGGEYEIINLGQ